MTKRMGRPPKPPTPGEMAPLSVRITAALKEKVQGAADTNGRSISAEVESRLERSFDRDSDREAVRKILDDWLAAGPMTPRKLALARKVKKP